MNDHLSLVPKLETEAVGSDGSFRIRSVWSPNGEPLHFSTTFWDLFPTLPSSPVSDSGSKEVVG